MKKKFRKTFNHIYMSLMLITSVLLLGVTVISGFAISNMMYNTYERLFRQRLDRGVSACLNYVRAVRLSIARVAERTDVITFSTNENAVLEMDLSTLSDKQTADIAVYAADGRIYASPRAQTLPTLAELGENPKFAEFADGSDTELVLLHCYEGDYVYDDEVYIGRDGMVTCVNKIFDGNNALSGYVVADIKPVYLYEYLDFSADEAFGGSMALIRYDDDYFPLGENYRYLYDSSHSAELIRPVKSQNGKYLVMRSETSFFGGSITVGVALANHYRNVFNAVVPIAVSAAVLMAVAHFAARAVAKHTDRRLGALLDKFDSTNLDNML